MMLQIHMYIYIHMSHEHIHMYIYKYRETHHLQGFPIYMDIHMYVCV